MSGSAGDGASVTRLKRGLSAALALALVGVVGPALADAKAVTQTLPPNWRASAEPATTQWLTSAEATRFSAAECDVPVFTTSASSPARDAVRREVDDLVRAATPRVKAAVGYAGDSVAVVVPDECAVGTASFAGLTGLTGDVSQTAAATTAENPPRMVINPPVFRRLSPLGRQVVVAHELTHVATHGITGPDTPAWLAEGFADLVAYRGVQQPLAVAAQELGAQVGSGRMPTNLPTEQAFRAGAPAVAEAYQSAWLAVVLLHGRYGDAGLLAFYREVGRFRGVGSQDAVDQALRRRGTSMRQFTADWQAMLVARLSQ